MNLLCRKLRAASRADWVSAGLCILGVSLALGPRLGFAATAQDAAAAEAQTYGAARLADQVNAASLLPANAASSIPVYTGTGATSQTSGSMTGQFANGKGNTVPAGSAKSTSCMSSSDIDCQAVQLVRGFPDLTSTKSAVAGSAEVTRANQIRQQASDPAVAASNLGQVGAVNTADCYTNTTTTPAQTEIKTCSEFANPELKTCEATQKVVVDPSYLYQCLIRGSSDVGYSCSVGQEVTVDPTYNYQCQIRPRKETTYTCDEILTPTVTPSTCVAIPVTNGGISGIQGCQTLDGHDWWKGWAIRPFTCSIGGKQRFYIMLNGSMEGEPATPTGCGPGIIDANKIIPNYSLPADIPQVSTSVVQVDVDTTINTDTIVGTFRLAVCGGRGGCQYTPRNLYVHAGSGCSGTSCQYTFSAPGDSGNWRLVGWGPQTINFNTAVGGATITDAWDTSSCSTLEARSQP